MDPLPGAAAKAQGNGKGKAKGTEAAVGDEASAGAVAANAGALVVPDVAHDGAVEEFGNDEHHVYCRECKAWVAFQRCRVLSKTAGTLANLRSPAYADP